MTAPDEPTMLTPGLFVQKAPALPKGYQIKCAHCGCSVSTSHEPWSSDCEEARRERIISQSDSE